MTWTERITFEPTTAIARAHAWISKELHNANVRMRFAAGDYAKQRDYLVAHPSNQLERLAGFELHTAALAWDALRNTYGTCDSVHNGLTALYGTPCRNKWTLIAETALPAVGEGLWLIFTPSLNQIVQNYLHPRGKRSERKSAKDTKGVRRGTSPSGRKRRRFPRIPDPDKLIAQHIPGAKYFRARQGSRAEQWLWEVIDITDYIGWFYLIYDAIDTTAVAWNTGIVHSGFCDHPWFSEWDATYHCTASRNNINFNNIASVQLQQKIVIDGAGNVHWIDEDGNGYQPLSGYAILSITVHSSDAPEETAAAIEWRLLDAAGNTIESVDHHFHTLTSNIPFHTSMVLDLTKPGARSVEVWAQTQAPYHIAADWTINLFADPPPIIHT